MDYYELSIINSGRSLISAIEPALPEPPQKNKKVETAPSHHRNPAPISLAARQKDGQIWLNLNIGNMQRDRLGRIAHLLHPQLSQKDPVF